MPLGDRLRDLFDGDDDDGLTEAEMDARRASDPPPAPDPERERSHPLTTSDDWEGPWPRR